MKTTFRRSFLRDLKKIKDRRTLDKIQYAIEDVERAESLRVLVNIKKMSGTSQFYRIRVGDYRIGLVVEKEVVEFVRVLHRGEIYRYFP